MCAQARKQSYIVNVVRSWQLADSQSPTAEMIRQLFPASERAVEYLSQMEGMTGVLQAIKYMPDTFL